MPIDYTFKDESLKTLALTHISYANEHNTCSNQRLEFLGDSILSFIIATYLYREKPHMDEGELTEYRALVVCEKSLAQAAKAMDLGELLIMGNSEVLTGGKDKPSILADAFEAVLGAIYLDGGVEAARKWAEQHLEPALLDPSSVRVVNYKSELQTLIQQTARDRSFVEYNLIDRSGPDHEPIFKVEAVYNGKVIGYGSGTNRKDAEQIAAKEAYEKAINN